MVDAEDRTDITDKPIDGIKGEVRRRSGASERRLSILDDGVMGSFETMMEGFTASYPTGYIRMSNVDENEKTKLCNNLPQSCVDIRIPNILKNALFPPSVVRGIVGVSPQFKGMMENQYPEMVDGVVRTDLAADTLSGLYGWNNGTECISIPQPTFYNVTRLQDLPCPFKDDEKGRDFGWVIYKYCGSESDNAHFNVSISITGKTTGPQGAEFMNCLLYTSPSPRDKRQSRMPCWA